MKSPIIMTGENRADNTYEQENNSNQSFENLLEILHVKENNGAVDNEKFSDFLGDVEESTEISTILNDLNTTFFTLNKKQGKQIDSDTDETKSEILKILKLKRQPNTISIPSRSGLNNNKIINDFNNKNIHFFPNKTKKISMAGRILKDKDSSSKNEIQDNTNIFSYKPERLSNPIIRNYNFQNTNKIFENYNEDKNAFFKSSW